MIVENNEVFEIINEAYEYSIRLYNGMDSLVQKINSRDIKDLETSFKEILEGFNWLFQIIILLNKNGDKNVDLEGIEKKVKLFIEAYSNLDILLFSNLIEYELMPQVEEFYNILLEFKENIT